MLNKSIPIYDQDDEEQVNGLTDYNQRSQESNYYNSDVGKKTKYYDNLLIILIIILSIGCTYQIVYLISNIITPKDATTIQQPIVEVKKEHLTPKNVYIDIFSDDYPQKSVQHFDQERFKLSESVKNRVQMGEPTYHPRFLAITKISRSPNNQLCGVVNGVLVLTQKSVDTMISLMNAGVNDIIIFMDRRDIFGDQILEKYFKKNPKQYTFSKENVTVDSDYQFITAQTSHCKKIIYLQNYFQIDKINAEGFVSELKKLGDNQVRYAEKCKIHNQNITLQNLSNVDLGTITSSEMTKYLLLFDPSLLKILGPLNFAYYNKYTIEDMILYPLLAVTQGSNYLSAFSHLVYAIDENFVQFKEFILRPARAEKSKMNVELCYVSYPTNPEISNLSQLKEYMQSVKSTKLQYPLSIIIFLPYKFDHKNNQLIGSAVYLLKLASQMKRTQSTNSIFKRIKLVIRANKTVSSLSNYQSVYTYCPTKSLVIASRHNIVFSHQFMNKLGQVYNAKNHYYFTGFIQSGETENKQVILQKELVFPDQRYKFRNNALYYNQYFSHMQIFKADLLKMLYLQMLKCKELDFYETEASFVLPMLQMVQLKMGIVQEVLYTINKRSHTEIEKQELINLKSYFEMVQIPNNMLIPYPMNSLGNVAFRRYAPDKIPPIIHQVWIGDEKPSKFRMKLHETLKSTNPDFNVQLWGNQNITVNNFPLTYSLIHRSLEYQKTSNRSYNAPIVSLIRYEVLCRYGGVYLDFKSEGLKPLNPFLKYQIFFTDATTSQYRFGNPDYLGNPIMGAQINSYHLKLVLTQLIVQQKVNYVQVLFPAIVGAYILRKAFNLRQIFTGIGLGFHLFSPRPEIKDGSKQQESLCVTLSEFTDEQQIFEIKDLKNEQVYKIGVPCRQYPEAYAIQYKPLGKTWVGNKLI